LADGQQRSHAAIAAWNSRASDRLTAPVDGEAVERVARAVELELRDAEPAFYDGAIRTGISTALAAMPANAELRRALEQLVSATNNMGQHLVYNAPTAEITRALAAARTALATGGDRG
jgi:hypothetical protein